MSKTIQKLLSLLLCLVMALSLFPAAALAEEPVGEVALDATEKEPGALPEESVADETQEATASGACGENLTWTLDNEGVLTISGTGDMWNWEWEGAPWYDQRIEIKSVEILSGVTNIGEYAFQSCSSLTSVAIPSSVTGIRGGVFLDCSSLTNVTIPSSVTSIGSGAFQDCISLTSIAIPEGVTSIGNHLFAGCSSLTSVTIPESVDTIQRYAFSGCSSLTSVTIPGNVTNVENHVFFNCSTLTDIYYDGVLASWKQLGFYYDYYSVTVHCSDGDIAPADSMFCGYDLVWKIEEDGSLTISGTGEMWDWAYNFPAPWYDQRSKIIALNFMSGVSSIGIYAFRFCNNLTNVTIPASVSKIGVAVFDECFRLNEIRFEGHAPEINEFAFSGVTATAYYPANDPTWTEEVRQNYGGTITWVAYESAPAVVASGECGDNLTWTLDGNGALTISGSGEMWELSNTGYPWDPYSEQIQSLTLGAEVTLIGSGAFSNCGNIQTISFAGAAPSFGDDCFAGLTASARYPVGTGTWIPDVRSNYGGAITWVPIMTESGDFPCGDDMTWRIEGTVLSISGTGEMWDYNGWDHFSPWYELDSLNEVDTLVIGEGVTVIGEYAFAQGRCESWIRTASLPSTLLRIEKGAFWQSRISQITFPEGLETIEDEAFMLGGLQGDLIIPSSVKTIGTKAFWYNYLDSVTVGGSIEDIGYLAFGQNNITDITFGNTMERWNEIGKDTGYDVYQTTIHCTDGDLLPATKEQCGEGLSWDFSDGVLTISGTGDMFDFDRHEENGHTVLSTPWIEVSDQITGVMIESGVTSIGNNAFCGCANLAWCQIPEGVTRIGWCSFFGCENMQSITIPESVVAIEDGAFVGTGLRSITIPAGLSALGEGAFSACFYLESVIFLTPEDSGNAGTNTVRLKTTGNTNGLVIGASAFSDCSNLTEVILRDHIVEIGEQAFYNCDSLQSVTIPANVTNVGAGAFAACDALEEILVDEQNTAFQSIDGVLYDMDGKSLLACPGGKEGQVVIPESVKTISAMAFLGCSGLTSVTIPESVTSVGSKAFQDCTTMTEIRFEGAAPDIGDDALGNVTATVCYPDNDPSWTEEVLQNYGGDITWVAYEPEEPEHTPGDINGDGKANNKDATRLQRYLKGENVEIVEAALDVNGDGKVNNKDLTRLQRYLKGVDAEIH